METCHKGLERDLTREDTVFIRGPVFDLNTCKIFIGRENPCDNSFSISIHQCFWIDLKSLEDGAGEEGEIILIPFFFWKPVQLRYGESHRPFPLRGMVPPPPLSESF